MNLAFSIGNIKATDILNSSGNISYSYNPANSTIVGLIGYGNVINGSTNSTYSGTANMISLSQIYKGNGFTIAITNATFGMLTDRAAAGGQKIPSTTYGSFPVKKSEAFPLYLAVFFGDIILQNNIIGSTFSGRENFFIRNSGKMFDGRMNIMIEVGQ